MNATAVTTEPVEVVTLEKERGKAAIGLGELPRLNLCDFIECRGTERDPAALPEAHIRCETMPEILRIPVKFVGGPDDAERGDRNPGASDLPVVRRTDVDGKTFDTVVRLCRGDLETAAIAIVEDGSEVDR